MNQNQSMNYTHCYLLQCRTNRWIRQNIANTEEQPNQNALTDLNKQAQESVDLVKKERPQQHLGCDTGKDERLFLKRTNQNAKAFSSQKKDYSDTIYLKEEKLQASKSVQ